jgi:hypothetical protein
MSRDPTARPRRGRQQRHTWEVRRFGSSARFLGVVEATDEAAALKVAIKQLHIPPAFQDRLLIRRQA